MIVAIYACENIYGGLHGIESLIVTEVKNINEARYLAQQESIEVMELNLNIMADFANNAEWEGLEEGTEAYDIYIEECIQDNVSYQIWEVISPYGSIEEMEDDFYNDREDFVKNYCKEIE